MATGSADLVVRVAANITALQQDMAKAAGSIKTIEDATTSAQHAARGFVDGLKEVAGAVGLAFSVERVIDFMRVVAEEAHQLHVLSLQTQINVEDLQVLAAATREYGVEGETLGRAIYQLSRRIAGGDESVATAYHLMGMSLEEVKGKNAFDLFMTTERGLGTLHGSIRDTAAADLYGGKLGVSMGAFSTGVDEAVEKAQRLNTIASTESVAAAAEYVVAVDRMTHSLHAWVMELEGGAAQGFNVLADAVDKGASKWDLFVAMLKDAAKSTLPGVGQSASSLATLLDHLNETTEHGKDIVRESNKAHGEAAKALDAHGQAARFMASLELDSAKPLLEWQTEYLGHLKDIGQLTAKNAEGVGVNVEQLKRYEEAQKKSAEAIKLSQKAEEEYATQALKHLQELRAAENKHGVELLKDTSEGYALIEQAGAALHDFLMKNALDAASYQIVKIYDVADAQVRAFKGTEEQRAAFTKQVMDLADLEASYVEYKSDEETHHIVSNETQKQAAVQQTYALVAAGTRAEQAALVEVHKIADASMVGLQMRSGTQSIAVANQYEALIERLMTERGYGASSNPMVPARAKGGPVSPDTSYLVGEEGPELFVPSQPGTIVPSGATASTNSGITSALSAYTDQLRANTGATQELDAASMAAALTIAGLRAAYLDESKAVHEVNGVQEMYIKSAIDAGATTKDVARVLGVTTDAVSKFVDSLHATIALDKLTIALDESITRHAAASTGVAALTSAQKAYIVSAFESGASTKAIGDVMGVTTDIIAKYTESYVKLDSATQSVAGQLPKLQRQLLVAQEQAKEAALQKQIDTFLNAGAGENAYNVWFLKQDLKHLKSQAQHDAWQNARDDEIAALGVGPVQATAAYKQATTLITARYATTEPIEQRDSGGAVVAGQSYYIGTGAQPELFTPMTAGIMTPAGAGQPIINNIYVTQPLGTPAAIAAAVGEALMTVQRGRGARFPVGV